MLDAQCDGYGVMTPSAPLKLTFIMPFCPPMGAKTPEKLKFAGDLVNELINSCLVLCWWSSLRIKSCLSISGAKDNTTLKRCGGAEVMCYSSGSVSLSG